MSVVLAILSLAAIGTAAFIIYLGIRNALAEEEEN